MELIAIRLGHFCFLPGKYAGQRLLWSGVGQLCYVTFVKLSTVAWLGEVSFCATASALGQQGFILPSLVFIRLNGFHSFSSHPTESFLFQDFLTRIGFTHCSCCTHYPLFVEFVEIFTILHPLLWCTAGIRIARQNIAPGESSGVLWGRGTSQKLWTLAFRNDQFEHLNSARL